ncbi:MAG: hypothetical protein OER90_12280 [Gemmatimonadota bacterium]|nr:hypothetical protein [Gemmatimonadota bacterium]
MDEKERAIVATIHDRIRARAFDENDVLSFLIVTRHYAGADTPLRELGDFVAHRERDRGLMQRYLQHVCEFRDAFLAGRAATLHSKPVFGVSDVHASLGSALEQFDLPLLCEAEVNDVLATAMSILQQVQLFDGKKHIGRLVLARTDAELQLLGLVHVKQASKGPVEFAVPALAVQNSYCGVPKGTTPVPFDALVEAKCFEGRLKFYVNGIAA